MYVQTCAKVRAGWDTYFALTRPDLPIRAIDEIRAPLRTRTAERRHQSRRATRQNGASALRRTRPYGTAFKPAPTPGNPRTAKDRRDSRVMARHPNDVSHRR